MRPEPSLLDWRRTHTIGVVVVGDGVRGAYIPGSFIPRSGVKREIVRGRAIKRGAKGRKESKMARFETPISTFRCSVQALSNIDAIRLIHERGHIVVI